GAEYPMNFVVLFAAGVPIMGLAVLFSQFLLIPAVEREPEREPAWAVIGLLIGLPLMFVSVVLIQTAAVTSKDWDWLRYPGYATAIAASMAFINHFRTVLQQRVLLLATVVTI